MPFLFVRDSPADRIMVLETTLKALKLLFLSAGLISTLLMVKGDPCEIVFSSLVGFWNSIRCFLSSSFYICIIINSMVVLIAALSAFHDAKSNSNVIAEPPLVTRPPPSRDVIRISPSPPCQGITEVEAPPPPLRDVIGISPLSPPRDVTEVETLPSRTEMFSKIGNDHDGSTRMHEIEETSNDQSNEEDGTMEATWEAITGEGNPRPDRKQLKKSETWDVHAQRPAIAVVQVKDSKQSQPSIPARKELKKSETFNETAAVRRRGGLRRDPSLGLDEFNQQVEAFIKKFNDDMRLQRQESDQRFLDMIKRGL